MNDSLSWSPARHPPSRRPTSPSPSSCPLVSFTLLPYFVFTVLIAAFSFSLLPLSPSFSLYRPCHPLFLCTTLVTLSFSLSPLSPFLSLYRPCCPLFLFVALSFSFTLVALFFFLFTVLSPSSLTSSSPSFLSLPFPSLLLSCPFRR